MAKKGLTLKRYHPTEEVLVTCRWNMARTGMLYEVWEASDDRDDYRVYSDDLEFEGTKGFGRLDTKEGSDIERIRQIILQMYPVTEEAVPVESGMLLVIFTRAIDQDPQHRS